jgi:hypothetical protein
MWGLRVSMPKKSMWRVAQFDTLRLCLVKIAGRRLTSRMRGRASGAPLIRGRQDSICGGPASAAQPGSDSLLSRYDSAALRHAWDTSNLLLKRRKA